MIFTIYVFLSRHAIQFGPYLGNHDTPYSNSIHSIKYVDINPIDPSQLILPTEPQALGSSSSFATQPPFLPGGGIAGTLVSQRGGGGSSHLTLISNRHVGMAFVDSHRCNKWHAMKYAFSTVSFDMESPIVRTRWDAMVLCSQLELTHCPL